LIGEWLQRDDVRETRGIKNFSLREFTFVKESRWSRYLTFKGTKEWKEYTKEKLPDRIDIGAIYEEDPKVYSLNRKAVAKELVFDFDLVGVECVDDASWTLLQLHVNVVEKILKEVFGFKHLLFVFSGRRGFHCWVADSAVMKYSSETRGSIVNFLTLDRRFWNEFSYNKKRHSGRNKNGASGELHPNFQMISDWISGDPLFPELLKKMDFFNPSTLGSKLDFLDSPKLTKEIVERFETVSENNRANMDFMWMILKKKLQTKEMVQAFVLYHFLPVVDGSVTRSVEHLLKAPFSLHPGTGNICVPLAAKPETDFKGEVFTIQQVLNQEKNLTPFVSRFNNFLAGLKREASKSDLSW
jgi:DNA primase small subunit